ncbi:MAG: glycosyltransferase family 39 protein [Candidatus Omnitrophica bacterium]|nr:glycosyltransferase family 39 protein [Candidatus Omnitrophota bacterium]MBU1995554.1 glycosyltransferase family 39 protein [Candidatus Omnitrophota bacterium]
MKGRISIFFFFFILLIAFFLIFKTDFNGPDQPIYYAYTESIVEDGDLNVINNINFNHEYYFPEDIKSVTKTYNFPDFHGHGGVILWIPFYAYGKFLSLLPIQEGFSNNLVIRQKQFIQCLMSFSTILFGFLVLVLTYLLCRVYFSSAIALFSTLIVCFGTPYFYFMLIEVGNAQILASLFSVISIWAVSFMIGKSKKNWFVYGLFFGMCLVVKADLWAQIFFLIFLFAFLIKIREINWTHCACFLAGVFPIGILKIINDYIKYGEFHIGEIGILNLKMSYLFEMLFSSYRGYFYTSPVFYLCFAGFIIVLVQFYKSFKSIGKPEGLLEGDFRDIFIFILSVYLFIKIFIISRNFAWGGGTPGARVLLAEFPVFVMLLARILDCKKKYVKLIVSVLSVVFVLWNMLVIAEFLGGLDFGYALIKPAINLRIIALNNVSKLIFQIRSVDLKLYTCFVPLIIISNIAFYLIVLAERPKPYVWHDRGNAGKNDCKMLAIFTVFISMTYLFITMSNVKLNNENTKRLRKTGYFNNAVVLERKNFERRENVGSMREMIEYFTFIGDNKKVFEIKNQIEILYEKNTL